VFKRIKLRKEMKEKEEEKGNAKKEGMITSFFLFFSILSLYLFFYLILSWPNLM
jgi:hypothetical protein